MIIRRADKARKIIDETKSVWDQMDTIFTAFK